MGTWNSKRTYAALESGWQPDLRSLQDLPGELLDEILLKSIDRKGKMASCRSKSRKLTKWMKVLRTICSQWNTRIRRRSFRKMVRHRVRNKCGFSLYTVLPIQYVVGLRKLHNKMYVLCNVPSSIVVFEDSTLRKSRKTKVISLKHISLVNFVLESSVGENSLYVHGKKDGSTQKGDVWKVNGDSHDVTEWIDDITAYSIVAMDDNNVMILTGLPESLYEIRIYKSDAELAKCIQIGISSDIHPVHAFPTFPGRVLVVFEGVRNLSEDEVILFDHLKELDYDGQEIRHAEIQHSHGVTKTARCGLYLDNKRHRLYIKHCCMFLCSVNVWDYVAMKSLGQIEIDCHFICLSLLCNHRCPQYRGQIEKGQLQKGHLQKLYEPDRESEFEVKRIYLDSEQRLLFVTNWARGGVDVYKVGLF